MSNTQKTTIRKGDPGYIKAEQKRRMLVITAACFLRYLF